MKKLIAVLLSIGMLFALASCSSKKPNEPEGTSVEETTTEPQKNESPAQILYQDFRARVSDGAEHTAESLANDLVSNSVLPFMGATAAVEPGFLNGFTKEITGFAEAASFGPVIGSIPFIGYIFTLDEGADVDAFMQTLKDSADLRWNICVSADEMVCEKEGNTVFFVMSPSVFEEEGTDAVE